jgi:hypothetical protein
MSANRILSSTSLQPMIDFVAIFRLDAMIASR